MSLQPSRDLLTNLVHQQIKKAIRVCLDNECFGAATILVYSGIDTMVTLTVPIGLDVQRPDFVRWADRYMSFCMENAISGNELYSARCAMLHNYSVNSNLTRKGQCRQIGYMDDAVPSILFNPSVSSKLVLVSVCALAKAFFEGVDRFLVDVFSNPATAPLAEARLRQTCQQYAVGGSKA